MMDSCFLPLTTQTDFLVGLYVIDTNSFDGVMPVAILLVIVMLLNTTLVHCIEKKK